MSEGRLPERLAEEIQRRFCGSSDARVPSERQLAVLLGASRAMVREALAILRARGQIGGSGGQPAQVRRLPPDPTAAELLETRSVLEGEIAALAAVRAGPAGHSRLREQLRAMFSAETPQAYWAAERLLHGELLELAGNALLAALAQPLLDAAYDGPPPADVTGRLRTHQRLVAAIGRVQPQLARDLLIEVVSAPPLAPSSSG